ncbi:LOW QUALITY PROTEIN: hypothetical protein HID58_085102 [Brassica napus]|uniref:Uncharacterized protein n=2 Tax=Brassica napus TaxID=3708 RepID=A0ABQ7XP64_BRANA|nr:LOW QUALITY PROTEIN: hypothetical protein HID58_085102 [Brassica napus]
MENISWQFVEVRNLSTVSDRVGALNEVILSRYAKSNSASLEPTHLHLLTLKKYYSAATVKELRDKEPHTNEEIQSLMSLVREEIGIGEHTPVVLSYQLPPNILLPYGSKSAPTNVLTGEDVELMMSVQEWTNDVQLCVTFGATNVAKYQFLCKEPFTIDGTTFFSDGVTEEEHIAAILDMAGDDEIDVSGPGHGEIFSEKNLVLVYRLALEIEKARSMFGTNMSRSNDLGDDGRDVNQNTKPPETEEPQESPSEQGTDF